MNPGVIVIAGKTYHSVGEMPADVRQAYEQAMRSLGDANNNQVPDAFEDLNLFVDTDKNGVPDMLQEIASGHATVSSMKIVVDGKEFNGVEKLPPEAAPDTTSGWMLVLAGLLILLACAAGLAGL